MFINTIPFLITHTRKLKFGTVEALENQQQPTIEGALKAVIHLYTHRGFTIDTIFADPEFEPLRSSFPNISTCGSDDHVPEIEQYI